MKFQKIKSYPACIIKIDDGVLVTRGVVKFKIIGNDTHPTIQKIMQLTEREIHPDHLLSEFDTPLRSSIQNLIGMLIDRQILYYSDDDEAKKSEEENPEDIFYWHFDTLQQSKKTLSKVSLLISGINATSSNLIQTLYASGFNNITLVDDPILGNPHYNHVNIQKIDFELQNFLNMNTNHYDCVIATTDFNNITQLRYWNEICLKNKWCYFPLSLNNIHGQLGPLIVPNETACYECFITRINSNLSSPELFHLSEHTNDKLTNGYHPAMPAILAGLAGIELTKLFSDLPSKKIGKLIDINFITQEMTSRKILRIPYCQHCS